MLEERIKIATETAVRGPAKPSGIFPQPDADLADCQKQVCFSSLFSAPGAPGSLYPTIFISIITKPYFTMSFFPYCYYSFIYLTKCFPWPPACGS